MKAQAGFLFLGDLPGKIYKPVVCAVQLQSGYVFPSGTEKLKDTGTVKPIQPGMLFTLSAPKVTPHLLAADTSYGFQ